MENKIQLQSHEVIKRDFLVSSDTACADATKVLASLEILIDLKDNTRFKIEDPNLRDYLKDTKLVHVNEDDSFSCDAEQREACKQISDAIASFVDTEIRVFHEVHPSGKLASED